MVDVNHSTLLIKNLPSVLSNKEISSLLKCFGCEEVTVLSSRSCLKQRAFISFSDQHQAATALHRLHQLQILGCILTAEFAHNIPTSIEVKDSEDNVAPASPVKQESCHCTRKLTPTTSQLVYPANPNLKYLYPEPDANVLINVCGALLTVPKFYKQVIHLMNKMNLCPPFSPSTYIPPILLAYFGKLSQVSLLTPHQNSQSCSTPAQSNFASGSPCHSENSESEMESDETSLKDFNILPPEQVVRKRKKLSTDIHRKLQVVMDQSLKRVVAVPKLQPTAVNVFEGYEKTIKTSINLTLPSTLGHGVEQTELNTSSSCSGFGKIYPMSQPQNVDTSQKNFDFPLTKNFLTEKELKKGRLTSKEMNSHPLFKNHDRGSPSCRLYVKNVHKKSTEEDLLHIFGSFVDITNPVDQQMFDIRLMSHGRMKGQAFVGLPSIAAATRAILATNGYVLMGKPLVVSFARSAKPITEAALG